MIKIGTCGFSYLEWKGPFYPEKLLPQQMLAYYARHFSAVEINSTYYHIPPARNMAAMKRAEGRVEFSVKAHQDVTHFRGGYAEALPRFREAIGPLREAGRLGCVLTQFPFSFKASPENVEFLRRVAGDLTPDPVVVEFRHGSWITEDTFGLLEDLGLAHCAVDEPRLPNLPPPVVRVTASPPTCASTAGTMRSGGPMRRPGNATTSCTRRRSSPNGCQASDPSPPEPRRASPSSTITPVARRSQTPP
jgi:uncharacterized protein YecE (DUF72 family)